VDIEARGLERDRCCAAYSAARTGDDRDAHWADVRRWGRMTV